MNVFYYPDINDISFKNAENKIEKTAIFNESHDYLKITVIKSESASYSNYVGRNGGGGVGGGFIAGEKVKDAIRYQLELYYKSEGRQLTNDEFEKNEIYKEPDTIILEKSE